jgi:predicted XRE-type DNA-binding protein
MARNRTGVRRSRGNLFKDLGFPAHEAQHLLVRSHLMVRLEHEIASRGLTQAAAAKRLGVSQPRVSNLRRGRIELFSSDALIDMLARLGVRVRLVAPPASRRQVA